MSLASVPAHIDDYESELLAEWRPRARLVVIIGFIATLAIWIVDVAIARLEIQPMLVTDPWALAAIRFPSAIAPALGGLVLLAVRDNRTLAQLTILLTAIFAGLNDVAFYRAGHALSPSHVLVGVVQLFVLLAILPMNGRQRLQFFFYVWLSRVIADAGWAPAASLGTHIWMDIAFAFFLALVAAPIEYFYSIRRREFDSRRQLLGTVRELESSRDEIARAAQQLAISVQQITGATGQLASSADCAQRDTVQIATTVEEVAASADSLARRSQESASEAEENRSRTERVRERIEKIRGELDRLNTSIGGAGTRFDQLQTQSQQVGQFVDTIREIAAQTNLLALNAGIEASRAGEQGRGFGVVADEVRKLAEQAHESSEQVSESVAAVQEEVAGTLRIVREVVAASQGFAALFDEAKSDLADIAAAAGRVNDRNRANAVDAREQAQATGEISHGTSQVLHQVREFAQMSEEVTATARDLQTLAEQLQHALAKD